MESSSAVRELPQTENRRGFVAEAAKTYKLKLRQGQTQWVEYLTANPNLPEYPGVFPTGYGKTEIILLGYDVLRRLNKRTRLLVVVPTDTQLDQYVADLNRKARRLGVSLTKVVNATNAPRTLKYHRQNQAEVFVISAQALDSSVQQRGSAGHWLLSLLETGLWCGAADEYHHYADTSELADEGKRTKGWGYAIRSLSTLVPQWMALSATPDRKIGETIFGEPVVSVSYSDALEESVVKDVEFRVREYRVDMEIKGIGPVQRTTSEIREQVGDVPIDEWEARRELRYHSKYCYPILLQAVQCLQEMMLNAMLGERPQMLVYAFSCNHAKQLCDILRPVCPGLEVDWVGTGPNGRSDAENERIVELFTDGYDDNGNVSKDHSVDILVQVNKASEGFDSKPVSVIVDLSLTGLGPQKLQQYGRGTRFYYKRILVIYVPTDSDVANHAHLGARLFDLDADKKCECCKRCPECSHHKPRGECTCCDRCPDCLCHETKSIPSVQVRNAELIGGMNYEPSRQEVMGIAPELSSRLSKRYGHTVALMPECDENDYETISEALKAFHRKNQTACSEETERAFWSDQVKTAVGVVAAKVVRRMCSGSFDKTMLGDVCKRINARWKMLNDAHDASTAVDLKRKHEWLSDIEDQLIAGGMPSWLGL